MSATHLPLAPTSRPAPTISRERYAELARRVRLLSWASLAIIGVEGAVSITAGIVASSIARVAGDLAERHALRGYDAVHLASALAIEDPDLVMATWDRDLAAATAHHRSVVPAQR